MRKTTIGEILSSVLAIQVILGVLYHYNVIESQLIALIPSIALLISVVLLCVFYKAVTRFYNK